VRHGAISGQARLLAAVSDLDSVPAPTTEVAAKRLVGVIEALIPGDLSKVYLGDEVGYYNVRPRFGGRRIADLPPPWFANARDHEHIVVAIHDPTGLLVTCRRSDVGSFRSLRPTIDYGHFWRPFGIENIIGAPVDFPNEHAYLASYRVAGDFSDGEIRILDQLRPIASRLLRRSAVSGLADACVRAWCLAPREAEVFAFVGVGMPLRSIASVLGLSVGTVRTHLGKAYARTAVRSRAAATSALLDVVESTALGEAGRRLVPGEVGPLTPRESAVLRIAATGRTTSAIASAIGISMETTKTHLANTYRKLGVQNRSQALLLMGLTGGSLGASDRTNAGTQPRRHPTPTSPAQA
jgi:DNA-binding CsgD family transcriptional regulator